jgi:hypothetical protein
MAIGFAAHRGGAHGSAARRVMALNLALGLAMATVAWAQPLGTGPTHKGIVSAGIYQIFPENRPGNGIYLDGALLLSLPGQTILGAAQLAPGGRFIYLARGPDGKPAVGVNVLAGDTPPRLSEPVKGYEYVVSGFEGQGYKKFYRVTDAAVTDLLPASHTADGLTVGAQGVLFFHVGSTAAPAPAAPGEPAPAGQYGIRLHWLNPQTGAVKHLGRSIFNRLPTLKLAWLEDGPIQYTLADGTSETLSTSDFR